ARVSTHAPAFHQHPKFARASVDGAARAPPRGAELDHVADGLRDFIEAVGDLAQDFERTADPDLAIGGFADPFDVTDVDRRAVQTARHDAGDVEGAIADPSEGMGPGLTGLGLRPEVLERQSAAAPPG